MPIHVRLRWKLFSFLVFPADMYIKLIGLMLGITHMKTTAVYVDDDGNLKDID